MIESKRILLKPESRRELFQRLLKRYNVETSQELARMLKVSNSCIKKWKRGDRYIPSRLFDELPKREMVLDIKDENWGRREGGRKGIRKLHEKYSPAIVTEWRRKGGKKARPFWRDKGKAPRIVKKVRRAVRKTKNRMEKRWERILRKIQTYEDYFSDNMPRLDTMSIPYSKNDLAKGIILPQVMNELLAEEIGAHIGDGTLVAKRNYFSVRVSVDELEYSNHLAQLCFQLYNFKPKVFVRDSICGFEIYSKALFEFKKAFGLPIGKKKNIDIPAALKESRNMKLISACIRGIFDTDGCVYFMKNLKHSKITVYSQSAKLIKSLTFYLDKMGFEPKVYDGGRKIMLYGLPMLKLWMEKIGTNNLKHYLKLKRIINGGPWSSLDSAPSTQIRRRPADTWQQAYNSGSNPDGPAILLLGMVKSCE